jgi:site-specific DNA-methyltransferase (adenine-specific)
MPFDTAATVNESTITHAAQCLGTGLREARRSRKLTQHGLARGAGIDLATVRGLERGAGTIGPLIAILSVLEHRFADQPCGCDLGPWLAATRKSAGYSQQALAARIGVSKPTVIQVEHGRGNLRSLLLAMGALGLATTLAPQIDPLHGARLILGDCMVAMPTLPDQSVNAIITDLPYSLTAWDWDQPIPLEPLWEQFRRLLKPTGVIVLTASQPFTTMLAASNLLWLKYALVWEKNRATGFLHAKQKPLKVHEDILVFSPATTVYEGRSKRPMTYNPQGLVELEQPVASRSGRTTDPLLFNGKRVVGGGGQQSHTNYPTSILRFASERKPIHPSQKPLDLMRYLVRTYTNEGDTVLDCCFGSGTTGVAAVLEGRQFIGIEKDSDFFSMAKERIGNTPGPLAP